MSTRIAAEISVRAPRGPVSTKNRSTDTSVRSDWTEGAISRALGSTPAGIAFALFALLNKRRCRLYGSHRNSPKSLGRLQVRVLRVNKTGRKGSVLPLCNQLNACRDVTQLLLGWSQTCSRKTSLPARDPIDTIGVPICLESRYYGRIEISNSPTKVRGRRRVPCSPE